MATVCDIEILADRPRTLTVRLSGELDLAARPVVTERVTGALVKNADIERVAVVLGGVRFCDSSGVGALLDIRRAADRSGATVALSAPSAGVARVLDIAGIDDLLPRE
jgi:anti-sigma B factor antagonist